MGRFIKKKYHRRKAKSLPYSGKPISALTSKDVSMMEVNGADGLRKAVVEAGLATSKEVFPASKGDLQQALLTGVFKVEGKIPLPKAKVVKKAKKSVTPKVKTPKAKTPKVKTETAPPIKEEEQPEAEMENGVSDKVTEEAEIKVYDFTEKGDDEEVVSINPTPSESEADDDLAKGLGEVIKGYLDKKGNGGGNTEGIDHQEALKVLGFNIEDVKAHLEEVKEAVGKNQDSINVVDETGIEARNELRANLRDQIETVETNADKALADCWTELEIKIREIKGEVDQANLEIVGDVKHLLDALKNAEEGGEASKVKMAVACSANPVLNLISPFYTAGQYNGGNMISLEGPAGFSKTWSIRQMASLKEYDLFISHGCSQDIQEIETMVGGTVPNGEHGFIVNDGKLVEAFRAASEEKSVLLFLDEHFRFSHRAQEWLLTILDPKERPELGGAEGFQITTRKPVDGKLEVLTASCEYLHVIAASNLEERTPNKPYWDRFDHVRIDYSESMMKDICQSILDLHGVKESSGKLAERFAYLIGQSRESQAANHVAYCLSPRDLKRGCLFGGNTEQGIAKLMATKVADKCQSWDAETGNRVNDEGAIASWVSVLEAISDIEDGSEVDDTPSAEEADGEEETATEAV